MKQAIRFLLTFLCLLAILPLAMGAQSNPASKKKPKTQHVQSHKQGTSARAHGSAGQTRLGQGKGKKSDAGTKGKLGQGKGKTGAGTQAGLGQGKGKKPDGATTAGQGGAAGKGKHLGEKGAADQHGKLAGKNTGKMKHFDLKTNKKVAMADRVKFKHHRGIEGAEHWKGKRYEVFRRYHAQWHDHFWWRAHYPRIVFVLGGWYFWDAGWWYPAWGYAPHAYYVYDGPIPAHRDLSPDQVTANVQSQLKEEGYYHGDIDGLLGPLTRAALSDYQRDRGLDVTSVIDEPTLDALGLA